VSFAHADGYPVMQALIERGVVGDFRAGQEGGDGHLLRFGFTPLYTRFVDAWDAAAVLADVLASETWRAPRYAERAAVT
jgi:kynureninase